MGRLPVRAGTGTSENGFLIVDCCQLLNPADYLHMSNPSTHFPFPFSLSSPASSKVGQMANARRMLARVQHHNATVFGSPLPSAFFVDRARQTPLVSPICTYCIWPSTNCHCAAMARYPERTRQ